MIHTLHTEQRRGDYTQRKVLMQGKCLPDNLPANFHAVMLFTCFAFLGVLDLAAAEDFFAFLVRVLVTRTGASGGGAVASSTRSFRKDITAS